MNCNIQWVELKKKVPKNGQKVLFVDHETNDISIGYYISQQKQSVLLVHSHWAALPDGPNNTIPV